MGGAARRVRLCHPAQARASARERGCTLSTADVGRAGLGRAGRKCSIQTQLRCRRRLRGESLTDLVSDIRRMVALAYPGPTSAMRESVACYAFLEALNDPILALKIREREPPSLEQAFQIALRLESYANVGATGAPERNDKDRRGQCRTADMRSRRQRRPAITCYGCCGQGHYRSQCQFTQDSRPVEVSPPVAMAANRHIKGQSGLYLRMKVEKRWCRALLDTGSEITLIPTSWVKSKDWRVSNQQLQAANGTEIVVQGEVTVSTRLRDLIMPTSCLVAEGITEFMIGLDWINLNVDSIDVKNNKIVVRGRTFRLEKGLTKVKREHDGLGETLTLRDGTNGGPQSSPAIHSVHPVSVGTRNSDLAPEGSGNQSVRNQFVRQTRHEDERKGRNTLICRSQKGASAKPIMAPVDKVELVEGSVPSG